MPKRDDLSKYADTVRSGRRSRTRGWTYRWLGYLLLLGVIPTALMQLTMRDSVRGSEYLGFVFVGAAATMLLLGFLLVLRSNQLKAVSVTQAVSGAGGRPVMYLRSFTTDRLNILRNVGRALNGSELETDEQVLADAVSPIGPLIAIGRPGERFAGLGASRMYVGDDWKQRVLAVIKDAQLVVISIGDSQGLWWEVKNVVQAIPPRRVLIWVAPKFGIRSFMTTTRTNAREAAYRTFAERFKGATVEAGGAGGIELPDQVDDNRFIWFGDGWRPTLLGVKRHPLALWRESPKTWKRSLRECLHPVIMYLQSAQLPPDEPTDRKIRTETPLSLRRVLYILVGVAILAMAGINSFVLPMMETERRLLDEKFESADGVGPEYTFTLQREAKITLAVAVQAGSMLDVYLMSAEDKKTYDEAKRVLVGTFHYRRALSRMSTSSFTDSAILPAGTWWLIVRPPRIPSSGAVGEPSRGSLSVSTRD